MKKQNELRLFCLFVKMTAKLISREFVLLMTFSIISGCMSAVSVWAWKLLFDISTIFIEPDFALSTLLFPCILILFVLLAEYLLSVFRARYITQAEETIRTKLLSKLFDDINRIPADHFNSSTFYDSLQRIQGFLGGNRFTLLVNRVFLIIQSTVTCVSVSLVLTSYHYILIFLCLVSILPPAIFRILRGKRYYYLAKFQTSDKRTLAYYFSLLTSPESLKELRTYNACSYIEQKRTELQNKLHREESAFLKKNGMIQLLVDLSRTIGVGLGIAVTGNFVMLGKVSIGMFASSVSAFQSLQRAFSTILITFGLIDVDLLNFREFIEFEESLPEEKLYPLNDTLHFNEKISFRNVTYCYPGQTENAIDHLNIDIKKGETVAVFGLNGAGKSTFVKLLLGLYHPASGQIYIDDVLIDQYNPKIIHKETSAVFQDFVKYKLTLQENIIFGCVEHAKDSQTIHRAITMSGTDEVLSVLEKGAETQLGTEFGGTELSGGQWQRVAISRAMMKDASIIVLDEPTSAIDPLEEYGILSRFQQMTEGKTAIIVSHRVSLSRIADRILVFKDGKIAENGTHDTLLDKKGEYYELYTKQAMLYM